MIAKRIIGFALLAGMGYMGYVKLQDSLYDLQDDAPFLLFFIFILAIVLFFGVRRVLTS